MTFISPFPEFLTNVIAFSSGDNVVVIEVDVVSLFLVSLVVAFNRDRYFKFRKTGAI